MFAARNALMTRPSAGPVGLTHWSRPAPAAGSPLPGDVTSLILNSGAGAVVVSASAARFIENASAASNGSYYSAARGPMMADGPYRVSARHGGGSSSTDRGYGGGFSNADGTQAIFLIAHNATTVLLTCANGVITQRGSQNNGSATSTDTIELRYSMSGANVVYALYRTGILLNGNIWTDTNAATFGIPGRYPIGAFKHRWSSAQYYSPGIDLLEAEMI